MGLGFNWTDNSIEYVMALKDGFIADANYEIDLPDEWIATVMVPWRLTFPKTVSQQTA